MSCPTCDCTNDEHSFSSYMTPEGPVHVWTCHNCEHCRAQVSHDEAQEITGARIHAD